MALTSVQAGSGQRRQETGGHHPEECPQCVSGPLNLEAELEENKARGNSSSLRVRENIPEDKQVHTKYSRKKGLSLQG